MSRFSDLYGAWAIVTGASSGIGEAFAHALAARGLPSILVARRGDELRRVAGDIAQGHGVLCTTLEADLADPNFADALKIAAQGREIGLIVSNAAFNPAGAFLDHDAGAHQAMLDVNCRASVVLADAFLPDFARRGRGGFVLVSSMEAFCGAPFSSLYAASKAFTLSLGEGLWGELKPRGVDVLTICPGATDTPLFASRKMAHVRPMPAREVAEIGLDALGKKGVVIPGSANRWTVRVLRHLPRSVAVSGIGAAMRKMLDDLNVKTAG